jgi:hypothetical protein
LYADPGPKSTFFCLARVILVDVEGVGYAAARGDGIVRLMKGPIPGREGVAILVAVSGRQA